MKTKIKLTLAIFSTFLALNAKPAQAQTTDNRDAPKSEEFSGKVKMLLDYTHFEFGYFDDEPETKSINATTSLIKNEWGQDKIFVLFKINGGKRGCMGAELNFAGYPTAFNTYHLYAIKSAAAELPTPANSKAIGSMVVTDTAAHLRMDHEFSATTANEKGKCVYYLPDDSVIELAKNKPVQE
jgi:hypothetical protein